MSYTFRTISWGATAGVAAFLAACAATGPAEYASYADRITPGIFLEKTRAVIPEGFAVRKVFPPGLAVTKAAEGFVDRAYNDAAGYCTIAYGHLIKLMRCQSFSLPTEFRGRISEPQGSELLQRDMATAEYAVQKELHIDATDGQFAALADFVFNVGAGNFRNSTLLRRVNARQFDAVPFEFRRWTKAGGKVYPGLVRRRADEIKLFFAGTRAAVSRAMPAETDMIDIRSGESSR